MTNKQNKPIKIEIWSDIACPFCYIGKVKIERAIENTLFKDEVELIWKSYQLNPDLITDKSKNIYQSLAESKGLSIDVAKQMTSSVLAMGLENNIEFNFDTIVPANTSKAHQLLHFAKKFGKQTEAKSLLFEAYFIMGKNIDDMLVLSRIITQLQLNTSDFVDAIVAETYLPEIEIDQYQAQQMGVRGVPFFVFNNHFIISGAQPQHVFNNTLQNVINELNLKHPEIKHGYSDGPLCNSKDC
jgi:predicted DsbA family dithiol-disulfide isomerase